MNATNDNDLLGCTDARVWAERFVQHVRANPSIATDEGTMIAWFSGAIGAREVARDSATAVEWLKAYKASQQASA